MKIKILLLSIVLLSIAETIYSQNNFPDTISLTRLSGAYPIHDRLFVSYKEDRILKDTIPGVPLDFKNYRLFRVPMFYPQVAHINSRNNSATKRDSTILSFYKQEEFAQNDYDHYIDMICDYQNGRKRIIIDSNNNNDFSDDKVFDFKYSRKEFLSREHLPREFAVDTITKFDNYTGNEVELTFDIYHKGIIKKQSILIELQPYFNILPNPDVPATAEHFDHSFLLLFSEYSTGQWAMNKQNYNIYVGARNLNGFVDSRILILNVGEYNHDPWLDDLANLGIWKIDGHTFYLKTEPKLARYILISDEPLTIFQKNYSPKNSRATTAIEGKNIENLPIHILPGNSEMTLIHFWGSWCGPCKKDYPRIAEFCSQEKNNPALQCVGVSLERVFNENVLNRIIEKNQFKHPQIIDVSSTGTSELTERFNIGSVPNYIVLDKKGVIKLQTSNIEDAIQFINR